MFAKDERTRSSLRSTDADWVSEGGFYTIFETRETVRWFIEVRRNIDKHNRGPKKLLVCLTPINVKEAMLNRELDFFFSKK